MDKPQPGIKFEYLVTVIMSYMARNGGIKPAAVLNDLQLRMDLAKAMEDACGYSSLRTSVLDDILTQMFIVVEREIRRVEAAQQHMDGTASLQNTGRCRGLFMALELINDLRRNSVMEASPKEMRDQCQFCKGIKGGAPGNENVIGGVVCCDDCSVLATNIRDRVDPDGLHALEIEPTPRSWDGDVQTADIEGCARCGGDHKGLPFIKFNPRSRPIVGGCPASELHGNGWWTHWAACPATHEPIFMQVAEALGTRVVEGRDLAETAAIRDRKCQRCAMPLNDMGLCTGETCPFGSFTQDDRRGWIGWSPEDRRCR